MSNVYFGSSGRHVCIPSEVWPAGIRPKSCVASNSNSSLQTLSDGKKHHRYLSNGVSFFTGGGHLLVRRWISAGHDSETRPIKTSGLPSGFVRKKGFSDQILWNL